MVMHFVSNNHIRAKNPLLSVSQLDETTTTTIQQREPKYVLEVKHMKQGSALVLAINKLRISSDDSFDDVMTEMKNALEQYKKDMEMI